MSKHDHYFFDVSKYEKVDIYRLIEIIGITCPVAQHVFKKAAAAGQRGHKDLQTDWQNIMDSAARKLEMIEEDAGQFEMDDAHKRDGWTQEAISGAAFKQPYHDTALHSLELCGETDQARAAALAAAWNDGERRMDNIASSHGDGEHYESEWTYGENLSGPGGDFRWQWVAGTANLVRYRLIHE